MSMYEKYAEKYNNIWNEWKTKQDFSREIERHRTNRKRFYEKLKKHLSESERVLEIGCGSAIDTNIMASEKHEIDFFCMDISDNALSIAKKVSIKLKNKICMARGDVNKLFYKKESFDLVFSQGVVEHFSDPNQMINEQLYVLKKGGVLIINVPQKHTGYTLMKHWKIKKGTWEWGWETEYSYSRLRRLGKRYGLCEIDVFGYQYWKSWREPVFVLRDLYNKFHRRNPLRQFELFNTIRQLYDAVWNKIENKWGHFFMQNIVIVFQKRAPENN